MPTEDTSGFYKLDSDTLIVCGPNYILGPGFDLWREQKDTYTYPIEGWYWFNTEEQAYNFFGIEWYPEVYTMGLPKPWLNNTNNIENA